AISASRTASGDATLPQIGTSIGTPAYMAPEQAAGDPTIDHRADIYALGAMAYELLTGRHVFADRTAPRMLAAHMSEAPRPITELRPDLPAALAASVMQCLAKDPSDRPQQAGEIARALEAVGSSSGMQAMPSVLLGGAGMFRKALAIYIGAFVVVAVLAKAAIVGIGLPEWVYPGALIVMAIGLPIVLWTGYVQRVARRAVLATPTFTPGGTPNTQAHGMMATMALKSAPKVSWYRTARGGAYALGVFVVMIATFMGLRASGIGPFGSWRAAGKLARNEPILFTDFRTTGVDSALGRVVSDAVRAGLSGSSAFALVPPSTVVAAMARMQRPPTARMDSALAREIAVREGVKAFIDGDVTGVGTGYIVSVRLVRADSGIELASFRESGDGPRGLIDAADRLARALRAKAGESLRDVNATPALASATTGSLDALRKYSEAGRANTIGDRKAIELAREAVAIDSTFASAWSALGAFLSNYGGRASAIDTALTQAFRYRDRLPERERDLVSARYYSFGPGRDRAKAAAMYESMLARGDSAVMINLGEVLRSQREYARAESLNVAALAKGPRNGIALGNVVDMQLNRGDLEGVARTLKTIREVLPEYPFQPLRNGWLLFAQGKFDELRAVSDTLRTSSSEINRDFGRRHSVVLVLGGRLREYAAAAVNPAAVAGSAPARFSINGTLAEIAVRGPTPAFSARVDTIIENLRWAELPILDRPYFQLATLLARNGNPAKARALVTRYQAEVTDTSLRRFQEADLHSTLGEVALADGKWQEALAEFRRGDIGYDGKPANECAPCLVFNLGRAFDAGGQADSAALMFERYLATPFYAKPVLLLDPVRVPAIHERLGQIYEAKGEAEKATVHYRAFIE
ncbi:MAG: protein kinase, partial [Gemmatimonas sp.]